MTVSNPTSVAKRLACAASRVAPGAAEIVEIAQVAAGRERACAPSRDDHAGDGGIALPFAQLPRERAHHVVRHGIERVRTIERNEARGAAALEQDVGFVHGR